MHYKRLIPIILVKNGLLVRSQLFEYHQAIGDPIPTIKRLSDWSVDEIILLNIGNTDELDSRRDDKWHNIGFSNFSGGYLSKHADISIHSPINNYGIGEDINHILMHLMMQFIAKSNLKKKYNKLIL